MYGPAYSVVIKEGGSIGQTYATTYTNLNSPNSGWLFAIWYFANNASQVTKFYPKPYKPSLWDCQVTKKETRMNIQHKHLNGLGSLIPLDGGTLYATFGLQVMPWTDGKKPQLRQVITCQLFDLESGKAHAGVTIYNPADNWDTVKGMKAAFADALEDASFTVDIREALWAEILPYILGK